MFNPSPLQKSFFDAIRNEKSSILLEAVAGSGKTTTIIRSLKYIPPFKKTAVVAFNRHIKEELESKVPEGVIVRTVNGLGYAALLRNSIKKPKVNADKIKDIINDLQIDNRIRSRFFSGVRRMVSQAKTIGLVPDEYENVSYPLVEDTNAVWNWIISHHQIKFRDEKGTEVDGPEERRIAIRLARTVLLESLNSNKIIDFDDQIYLPVIKRIAGVQYNFLYVDEAQDISGIQRELFKLSLKSNGRLIAVGDKFQAIYAFRGADSESMDKIKQDFNCKEMPLSISYRCPRAVVRAAQAFTPQIQAADGAVEGVVREIGAYHASVFEANDLVLCRCVAPLIRLAFHCINKKVRVHVIGRDIGKNLIDKIQVLKPSSVSDLGKKIREWHHKETKIRLENDPTADVSYFDEIRDALFTFLDQEPRSINALIASIENLFVDNGNSVRLSTIHKAKGLEADRVYILDRHLMPIKYAVQPWQKKQESNLHYVAITRAKKELLYIKTPNGGSQ